jgi:hypothetical protein
MTLEGKRIWLLVSELEVAGVPLLTIRTQLKRNRKGVLQTWVHKSHPNDKRVKLVDYDSLPEITKSKLPSRADLLSQAQAQLTEQQINEKEDALDQLDLLHRELCHVSDFQYFLLEINNKGKAEDLKQAAAWLRLLSKYRTKTQTQLIGFEKKEHLRLAVLEKLEAARKQRRGEYLYGFKVSNQAVLQRKELEWSNAYEKSLDINSHLPLLEADRTANIAALTTLINANKGNSNRRVIGKLNEDESKRILVSGGRIDFSEWNARTLVWLFMNPVNGNKYDFENIYRRYQLMCQRETRKPAVTISAIKDFLGSDEVRMYTMRERHGWAEHDKMLPHVFGERPKYSLSKGGYDGLQVDFNSRIDGKQLMLTIVAVFDYASEAITGFDIGMVEDGKMVRTMYRNHLALLGGRSYMEIESDRFSGNLSEETQRIFTQTCNTLTQPTPNDPQGRASNPKARFVERLIQELNRLAQNFPGWKGTNITSIDRNRKPNPDYRNGNYVEGFAESKTQIIELINAYNHDNYNRKQSRWSVLMANINPKAPVISHELIAMLLNQNTTVKVTNGIVAFEVNRQYYEYDFNEFDHYVHKMLKGMKVKVYYDETDMTTVDVFGEREEYIATLGKLRRIARAKAEQTEEDIAELGRMVTRRNQTNERITRKTLEVEASMYGLDINGLSTEELMEQVLGARETIGADEHITAREMFNEALTSPDAKQHATFYEDRLIRAAGESVPVHVTKQERKTDEKLLRELTKQKFNKRNP